MASVTIPFEKQLNLESNRTCGAACLAMVYKAFGLAVTQEEIWPKIARPNRFGSVSSNTFLMVKDVIDRGYSAVAFQARHPLLTLRGCLQAGAIAIVNHRMRLESVAGHYSVVVGMDENGVTLHDPYAGPRQYFPLMEFLELWHANGAQSEIAGYTLIAISTKEKPAADLTCRSCQTPVLASTACPRCKQLVELMPAKALGCAKDSCAARMWNYVCCPGCDYMWTFSSNEEGKRAAGAEMQAPSPEAVPMWNQQPLFAAIDRFAQHLQGISGLASHPDLQAQIDFMRSSKERLLLAKAEEAMHQKAAFAAFAGMFAAAAAKEAAHKKKLAELQEQAAPLDGNALGTELLKNLGLVN